MKCSHFPINCCSECPLDAIPAIFSQAKTFFKQYGFDLDLVTGNPNFWRTRAKLAVRKEGIGLFLPGTHRVAPIPHCLAHHPKINEAVELIQKLSFSRYDEKTHQGDLRYIQLVVEKKSEKIQLTLVLNGEPSDSALINRWKTFSETHFQGNLWHSVWFNFQPRKNNVIFGPSWLHLLGPQYIWEDILGTSIAFGPSHFGQSNLALFEALLSDMKKLIQPNSFLLECYAGVGVISLVVSSIPQSIIVSEREESAKKHFEASKETLPLDIQKKLQFITLAANNSVELFHRSDTVIVDPPRKGLEDSFLEALTSSKITKQLIYVSCNFSSLSRDILKLLKAGWKITFAKSYLFFPGTNHIELLVVLKKAE